MAIDDATVRHVAKLAALRLDEAEAKVMAQELGRILEWVSQLDDVDVEGIEPMIMAVNHGLPMREDLVTDDCDAERILANAPRHAGGYFVVPKVVAE